MNRPIKTYDLYEVVKIPFPFTEVKAAKVRPALVLTSEKYFNAKIEMSIMAMITSLKPSKDLWPTDILIANLHSTGLPVPSIIRFKLFTLDHRLIIDRLGKLSELDCHHVQHKLKEILSL